MVVAGGGGGKRRAHPQLGGWGGKSSFVACLSRWTIDHASLSRRSTVPTTVLIETPPTFGCSLRFFHILHKNCLLILSPSRFAVCGHHLSPRIAPVTGGGIKEKKTYLVPDKNY